VASGICSMPNPSRETTRKCWSSAWRAVPGSNRHASSGVRAAVMALSASWAPRPSGTTTSRRSSRANSSAKWRVASSPAIWVARKSPVERSTADSPHAPSCSATAPRYRCSRALSIEASMTVPGVTTLVTSRLTRPRAVRGSSTWSQIATRYPRSTSRARYPFRAWCGTPHIGTRRPFPTSRDVSTMSSSRAAILASSKKSS